MMKLYHLDREATRDHSRDLLLAIVDPNDNFTPGQVLEQGNETFDAMKEAFSLGFYTCVAEIDSNDMNFAYANTQNIDDSWAEHPADGVQVLGGEPARSTHVGDILEDDGVYSAVAARAGFITLSWFAPPTSKPSDAPAP
ncbi:hypothetical protein O9X98_15670 [Agrobacterium salinitolerans]|nr:hypothetical protein [Agrobacterium salinitolerans]